MSVLVFDRINSVVDTKYQSPRLPAPIASIFAKAGVLVPSTGPIPLGQVDIALKGLGIEERMRIKSTLAELKLID